MPGILFSEVSPFGGTSFFLFARAWAMRDGNARSPETGTDVRFIVCKLC